jgi:site-specific recombinase XerD
VEEVTKKYVSAAKEKNPAMFTAKSYSPHSFRHSIAVHMLESGIPLPVIKTFLGHESIATTMLYAEVTPELANKYLSEHSRLTESAMANSDTTSYSEKLPFLKKHLVRT